MSRQLIPTKTYSKLTWLLTIMPFILVHIGALGVFLLPFSWKYVALCLGLYWFRMFAITAGYHRYFSHRTYRMGRVTQFIMAWIGTTALQKGVLWWAANHRFHHRHSDQEEDIHSPFQRGFWWSHVGWILSPQYEETQWDQIQDLAEYPELRWINRHFLIPPITFAVFLYLAFGLPGFVWGGLLSTVMLWHTTFTINSLSHVFGSRRYATRDTSRNNWILALLTMGEGWHNNHHTYMSSTNQGFYWWEIDISYYVLKVLSWCGIVSGIRKAPLHQLESKRLDRGAQDWLPQS